MTAAYRIPTMRRGRVGIGPARLQRSDLLGLCRRTTRLGGSDEVLVVPERVPLAFPRRDMAFILAIWSGWPNGDGADEKVARMRADWKQLEPLTQGFYTNYAGTDPVAARDRENFGANFERLVAVKTKYDPTNLFRLNANVAPKA